MMKQSSEVTFVPEGEERKAVYQNIMSEKLIWQCWWSDCSCKYNFVDFQRTIWFPDTQFNPVPTGSFGV